MMNTQTGIEGFNHSHTIQIRFNDIDILGHATNSVYQQYFDLGRMAYFREVFGTELDWHKEGLVLVSISIDYLTPIELNHSIEVLSRVVRLGNKSLEMVQKLFNRTTGEVAAESKAVMVGYSAKNRQSIPIPTYWRQQIALFETDLPVENRLG